MTDTLELFPTPGSGPTTLDNTPGAATEATQTPAEPVAKRPTHGCNGCDERWWGAGIAHCAAPDCHRTFSSVIHFDRHRDQRGDRGACMDPAGMTDEHGVPVLEYREGMWRGPKMTEEQIAKAWGDGS